MSTRPHCQLTTKDHAILEVILERYQGDYGPYLKLLDQKVHGSTVHFRDDIPPKVVTLNSRLTYFVDGLLTGPHLVVQGQPGSLPSYALSIHTLRGLALLGLAEGSAITVELGSSVHETLRVDAVLSQPEAETRVVNISKPLAQGDASEKEENIVSFRPRIIGPSSGPVFIPDDDDPGPSAA
ncbi:hypothetical protein [Mesorhizobium sp. 1B3]|uniref:hypothetical protein n=1 Tax=Mesorhizobium sp. 1B3 TaxID=3243599 RepID=UPI003D985F9E